MTPRVVEGRTFLVGCPRSGTTLLQAMLAAHPVIASFPESHFFANLAPKPFTSALPHRSRSVLSEFLSRGDHEPRDVLRGRRPMVRRRIRVLASSLNALPTALGIASPKARQSLRLFLQKLERPELPLPSYRHVFMYQHVRAFVSALDHLTVEQGKDRWLEKSPTHVFSIDLIERYVPAPTFLHVVRRGEDVVASLFEVTRLFPDRWGGSWSLDRCVAAWNRALRATLGHRGRANHLLVSYEELVRDSEAALASVARFLGVPFDRAMLSGYRQAAGALVRENEPWKQSVFGEINPSRSRFTEVFEAGERAYITSRLHPLPDLSLEETR